MTTFAKAVLINVSTLLALSIERWRGAPWPAILITAIIFFPMANALMYIKHRRQIQDRR